MNKKEQYTKTVQKKVLVKVTKFTKIHTQKLQKFVHNKSCNLLMIIPYTYPFLLCSHA